MSFTTFRVVRHTKCLRCTLLQGARFTSTTSDAPPPILGKIREDLKTAMRAKDKTRLNVLRAILSETTNAAKGPSPIRKDVQVLALLRKRIAGSKAAAQEFIEAKRDDLKEKQEAEIAILNEYAGQVETYSEEQISAAIKEAFQAFAPDSKKTVGLVMKELFRPGGSLDGKPVERSKVSEMVQSFLNTN